MTVVQTGDRGRPSADPAPDMLRSVIADIQPDDMADLLDFAGLMGEVDGGNITAQTIVSGVV